jgi:hypothetical protein
MCRHVVVDCKPVLGRYLEYSDICLRYHLYVISYFLISENYARYKDLNIWAEY